MKKLFTILFASASINALAQGPTLIAHWPFTNGGTTEIINGWTANSSSLGSPSATTGSAGASNTALKFRSGENLVYNSSPVMNLKSWTITAVVRPDSFYAGLCQHNMIIQRGDDYSGQHISLGYFDNWVDNSCYTYYPNKEVFFGGAAGNPTFNIADWGGNVSANPRLTTGSWYCVTISYDSSTGSEDLWVDGVHVISETGTWTNQYNYPSSYNGPLYIGSSNYPAGNYPYWLNGAVDDIKIYSGSLHSYADTLWAKTKCESDTDTATKPRDTTGTTAIRRFPSDGALVNIAPSPASDVIKITTPAEWQTGDFTIFNTVGAMVQHNDADNSGVTSLDISRLPHGMYIIDIEFKGHSVMKRFLKE